MGMKQFFVDDEGQLSCMRLMAFLVVLAVIIVWIIGNIRAGQYIPLGVTDAGIIAGAITGKAVQGWIEYGK